MEGESIRSVGRKKDVSLVLEVGILLVQGGTEGGRDGGKKGGRELGENE